MKWRRLRVAWSKWVSWMKRIPPTTVLETIPGMIFHQSSCLRQWVSMYWSMRMFFLPSIPMQLLPLLLHRHLQHLMPKIRRIPSVHHFRNWHIPFSNPIWKNNGQASSTTEDQSSSPPTTTTPFKLERLSPIPPSWAHSNLSMKIPCWHSISTNVPFPLLLNKSYSSAVALSTKRLTTKRQRCWMTFGPCCIVLLGNYWICSVP
mmetsp:Transcript_8473/g.18068  ORF Transcript_8473/g.18068 Transcript_8473/m.18068 type:complete len:204 (+) Transcript_8473:2099-2710(+)